MEKEIKKEISTLKENQKICNQNSKELERQIQDVLTKISACQECEHSTQNWEQTEKEEYENAVKNFDEIKGTKELYALQKLIDKIKYYESNKKYIITAETIHTERLVLEYELEISKIKKEIETKYSQEYSILTKYEEMKESKSEYDKNSETLKHLKENIKSDLKELVSLHSYIDNVDLKIKDLLKTKATEIVNKLEDKNITLPINFETFDEKSYDKIIKMSKELGLITDNEIEKLESVYNKENIEKIYSNRISLNVIQPKLTISQSCVTLEFWPKDILVTNAHFVSVPDSNILNTSTIKSISNFRENHPYIKVETVCYDKEEQKTITKTEYFDILGNKYSKKPPKNQLILGNYVLGKCDFKNLPNELFLDKKTCKFIEAFEIKKYLLKNGISQKIFLSKEDQKNIKEIKNRIKYLHTLSTKQNKNVEMSM